MPCLSKRLVKQAHRDGVDHAAPSLPGSVASAMHTPTLALADQDFHETVNDAVERHLGCVASLPGSAVAQRCFTLPDGMSYCLDESRR